MPLILNGSTGISGTDGSAGTPAVQGTDGNTGMFFPAADTIAFAEGGVEAMRLDASGNVGIGTTTPTNNANYKSITINGTTGGWLEVTNGTVRGVLQNGSADLSLETRSNHPLIFGTNSVERGRFTAGGDFQFNSGYGSVATAFGCRAWALIEGSGTVFIRGSGNLSSVTDLGTGDYRLNYSTAMPNVNYAIVGSAGTGVGGNDEFSVTTNFNELPATTTTRIGVSRAASGTFTDAPYISIAVFR